MKMKTNEELDQNARGHCVHGCRITDEQNGKNLVSKKESFFYIKLGLSISKNLEETESKLNISTNLPFSSYCWYGYNYSDVDGKGIRDFLDELEEWCKKPQFHPTHGLRLRANRINLPSFRKAKIPFESIKIEVGEKAQKYLEMRMIPDIKGEIKCRIAMQKKATEKEDVASTRYIKLLEELAQLNYQVEGSPSKYYQYGDFRAKAKKLDTLKKQEFNLIAKQIQAELNDLSKKFPFLDKRKVDTYEITKKPTMAVWLESGGQYGDQNVEDELQDNWDNDDDRDENYPDFESYCEEQYNNFLECSDFDE
jgi:hypothetical protein